MTAGWGKVDGDEGACFGSGGQSNLKDEKACQPNNKMPYAVQYRLGDDDWDTPILYEDCDTVVDVLMQLLADWMTGDADLHGTFAFLSNHGRDFGITDDEADENTDPDLLEAAGEAVLELCADNDVVLAEYLAAVGDRVLITELPEDEQMANENHE